jgi:nucleoside-diphosphate-sugar epimerase
MPERQTVLVTGAGGFIGGRVVELLQASGLYSVRAGVRRWGSAARIGRLPVDIVECDITDPAQLETALAGVGAVVHCAVGGREATVDGTRNLLEAALRHRVERVVHISTVDVYGDATGEVTEDVPLQLTGREYGDTKIEAEKVCGEYLERGLPIVLLRPTIVYGPFSESWTVEFAQRFQAGPWLLPAEDCAGACNLLYVDDLVGAIFRALETEAAVGHSFNINGPDRVTWNEYFQALNRAMGLPPLVPASRRLGHASAALMAPVRVAAKFALKRFSGLIMGMYQRYGPVKRVMRLAETAIRQTPTTGEFRMYSKEVYFPARKAQELLGYRPAFDLRRGTELSAAWLRHHHYVHSGPGV